jgi:hypothetical protein
MPGIHPLLRAFVGGGRRCIALRPGRFPACGLRVPIFRVASCPLSPSAAGFCSCCIMALFLLFGLLLCPCAAECCCIKNKCPSWWGKAPVRSRCQGRWSGVHRSEARTLTEQAGGSGAGSSQEGVHKILHIKKAQDRKKRRISGRAQCCRNARHVKRKRKMREVWSSGKK